jgi:hypothetical protein
MPNLTPKLKDRVKELTYSTGTSDFGLAGAADGFTPFSRFYQDGDVVFYAATDGVKYEVGSGVIRLAANDPLSSYDILERNPITTSNTDNSKAVFGPGVKEVFVSYVATHAVQMGSGIPNFNTPARKGVAVWENSNYLNYFPDLQWDDSLKSLSIEQPFPLYGIDLGGDHDSYSSHVRATGYYVGVSGSYYPPQNGGDSSYVGGVQYKHFLPNTTDFGLTPNTGSDEVIEFSGVVNQNLLFKKQNATYVFAGPTGVCNPNCNDGYPAFRPLGSGDLPIDELDTIFVNHTDFLSASGHLYDYAFNVSGNLLTYVDNEILSTTSSLQSYTDSEILSASGDLYSFSNNILSQVNYHESIASGLLTPRSTVSKTIPSMTAGDVLPLSFYVSGVEAAKSYAVSMSPDVSLFNSLLLTHAFVASDDYISGVFYAPQNFGGQTLDFHIAAHKIPE